MLVEIPDFIIKDLPARCVSELSGDNFNIITDKTQKIINDIVNDILNEYEREHSLKEINILNDFLFSVNACCSCQIGGVFDDDL